MDNKVSIFVIGAQKAGTTTLHSYLKKESSLSLPNIKETHFWSDSQRNSRGIEWYHSNFDRNKNILVEVDPDYSIKGKSIRQIYEYNPNSKIILIYRKPIERAYSQWNMSVRRGIEDLGFQEALNNEEKRLTEDLEYNYKHFSYKQRSDYVRIIKDTKKYFDPNNILVVDFKSLMGENKLEIYSEICGFMEFKSNLSLVDISGKQNVNSRPRFALINKLLWQDSMIKKIVGKLIPSRNLKLKLATFLDKSNQNKINKNIEPQPILTETTIRKFNQIEKSFFEELANSNIRLLK